MTEQDLVRQWMNNKITYREYTDALDAIAPDRVMVEGEFDYMTLTDNGIDASLYRH